MAKPRNGFTYILYPASEAASICSHFTSKFPNGFSSITAEGVDYYVLDIGSVFDCQSEHADMWAKIDEHSYHADILTVLKHAQAEEDANVAAASAALSTADAAHPGGSDPAHADHGSWITEYQSAYADAYDLAAAIAAQPTPDCASLNQAQARDFVAEYGLVPA